MYSRIWKRILDFFLSFLALIVLSPLLLILSIVGLFCMKGNPFFVQKRPGKNEKIFSLIKFRTMSNEKDKKGHLLPDTVRLNRYGRFLRKTSLDELPELLNILSGKMSIVGPRPLSVMYLPYYTEREHLRHSVRPGLTGLAQVRGRNATTWEERFSHDLEYIENISFSLDIQIIIETISVVLNHVGVCERGIDSLPDFDVYRCNL